MDLHVLGCDCHVANVVACFITQVLLRWSVQLGCAVIPKTSTVERLAENAAIFDFELPDADMEALGNMLPADGPKHFCWDPSAVK
jgi:diketogulonate reductase-like aldo/keto reductase